MRLFRITERKLTFYLTIYSILKFRVAFLLAIQVLEVGMICNCMIYNLTVSAAGSLHAEFGIKLNSAGRLW